MYSALAKSGLKALVRAMPVVLAISFIGGGWAWGWLSNERLKAERALSAANQKSAEVETAKLLLCQGNRRLLSEAIDSQNSAIIEARAKVGARDRQIRILQGVAMKDAEEREKLQERLTSVAIRAETCQEAVSQAVSDVWRVENGTP